MLQRSEYRQMLLAGTVTFPATFPQVGRLELRSEVLPVLCGKPADILTVTETPSSRVTMTRQVLACSVRAVFLPRDPQNVDYADGQWLLEGEIAPGLQLHLQDRIGPLYGIVFVAEGESSSLNVTAGMTAAESVQYYPPLPCDPSHNHYNAWPGANLPPAYPLPFPRREACSLSDVPIPYPGRCRPRPLTACSLTASPPVCPGAKPLTACSLSASPSQSPVSQTPVQQVPIVRIRSCSIIAPCPYPSDDMKS